MKIGIALLAPFAALLVLLALAAALVAVPADEARADSGHPGSYPLHCAAGADGDLALVVHVLGVDHGHGIVLNGRDHGFYFCRGGGAPHHGGNRNIPLHWAVNHGRTVIVATLIAAGAEVNAKNDRGHTPLHNAASAGDAAIVSMLIAARADVNARDNNGKTPLHDTAGNASVASVLIAAGADVNAEDSVGFTPLRRVGSSSRYADLRAVLIAAGGHWGVACAEPLSANPAGPTPPCSCESPNVGTADNCQPPMPSVEVCGGLDPPRLFDPTRVSITAGECTDRLYPCHDSAVRLDDNSGCECPEGAYAHGNPSGGEWDNCERYSYNVCLRRGEWRKSIPDTAICHADHAPLAHGLGESDWAAAITMNSYGVVSHLIADHGRDPEASYRERTGRYTYTRFPLHRAAELDSDQAALALIEGGADVNRVYGGETPLHSAARNSAFQTAKALLARGANPDATDSSDNTPLHVAARLSDSPENVALVSLLLDKGANPNIRNNAGWRPLDLAYDNGGRRDARLARRKMMAALITGGADWASECTGGTIPNENYRGLAQVATYPECRCPPHLSERDGGGECVCPAHSHSQVNELCLPKDSAQVADEIEKMRAELESLRMALAALNLKLSLAADGPTEILEEVAKQAEVAARGIARRRNNFLALARAGLAEADDAGAAPTLALSDTEATCRMLEGEVQTHSRSGAKICSGIDHNDTFCIIGSDSAFPCVGLFRHVRRCNDDHNRPALDPWHCAAPCPSGLRARGAKCAAD